MSHFYGQLNGQRGAATRCGSKKSGLSTVAASYSGAVSVRLWWDEAAEVNRYEVLQECWLGVGKREPIARGIVGE